jgi:prophage regulatory protein
MQEQLLRWPTVQQLCGISRPTAWRLERQGIFPARRKIASNSVGWLRSEIESWIQDRTQVSTTSGREK